MIDVLKAYVQVATGVGELTRQRAVEAARQALASSPAAAVLPAAAAGVDGLTQQASALADELLETGRHNRELLRKLVSSEVEVVVARLGIGQGDADVQAQLAAARARVRELEQALAAATSGRAVTRRAQTETLAAALAPGSDHSGTPDGDIAVGADSDPPLRTAPDAGIGRAAKQATKRAAKTASKTAAKTAASRTPTGSAPGTAPGAGPGQDVSAGPEGQAAGTSAAKQASSPTRTAKKAVTKATTKAPTKSAAQAATPPPGGGPAAPGEPPTPATAMPQVAPSDEARERAAALAEDGGTS